MAEIFNDATIGQIISALHETIQRRNDVLAGHLGALKDAIKAGDPHDELRWRVEEIERACVTTVRP